MSEVPLYPEPGLSQAISEAGPSLAVPEARVHIPAVLGVVSLMVVTFCCPGWS